MRAVVLSALIVTGLCGCSESNRCLIMPGHPYRCDPDCVRVVPPGKYDPRCDCPNLGYKGFCPPPALGSAP